MIKYDDTLTQQEQLEQLNAVMLNAWTNENTDPAINFVGTYHVNDMPGAPGRTLNDSGYTWHHHDGTEWITAPSGMITHPFYG